MAEILQFPVKQKQDKSNLEAIIEKKLGEVPEKDREKLKFELIKTIDSYDGFFSEWTINVPKEGSDELKKQLYDIAHQEHGRKMLMLAEIIKLKVQVLVDDYWRKT